LAQGVINAADYLGHLKDVLSNLGRHNIPVIPLGYRHKGIGFFHPGPFKRFLVEAITDQSRTFEGRGEPAEASGIRIQDSN
jgi:hypothetical protein